MTSINRGSVFEQQGWRNGLFTRLHRFSERFSQPILEQPDTTHGMGVANLPLMNQIWCLFQGELALERQQHVLKGQAFVFDISAIPGKMNINPPPGALPLHVST